MPKTKGQTFGRVLCICDPKGRAAGGGTGPGSTWETGPRFTGTEMLAPTCGYMRGSRPSARWFTGPSHQGQPLLRTT